jgi:hypothetical protein
LACPPCLVHISFFVQHITHDLYFYGIKKVNFDTKKFYQFCKHLRIESKEQGMITLGDTLLGTQTYVIDEVAKGLQDGIHFFIVLKGRQLGITTISLAMDLYWHFLNPGMQGTLTTDTEENRETV